ncbi:MAG: DNA primase [Gammaproteobacteria bacterium]|nr:DNA primase [Gammaproteobacteria bacterium]
MAGRIPQQFIDDLINRVDIVDVVDSRVALKKRGKEYVACCPFHNEKSPSFTVSQNKQFYHCFGCGAHGTALGFIMEYERLDFVDAVEALAADYHLEVPREDGGFNPQQQEDKTAIFDVLQKASKLFEQQLKPSQKAIDYLKGRGLSGEIAKTFELGYAPDSWDYILNQLGTTAETRTTLLKAGLLIEKTASKYYDRFRDRIMFPIRDRRGRVIGFGGRILDQGEPKYLNSPETPVFHKGQELYGLFEARQAVRDLKHIVIVEGYMDVVALAQHGIPYAVATLGTATSQDQISKLFRIVPEIIFCFDGDAAGQKAAWRALENALPVLRDGVQARFLFLPDGEDPDTLIRKEGQQQFEQRLHSATPLSDFMLDHLAEQVDLSSMDGRARLSELARPLIAKIADGVFKDLLLEQLSKRIGLSSRLLQQHMPSGNPAPPQSQQQTRPQPRHKIQRTHTRLAVALLLQHPEIAQQAALPEALHSADIPGLPLLFKLHQTIVQTENISPSVLLERWRGSPDENALTQLMQWDIPKSDEQNRLKQFKDSIEGLQKQHIDQRTETLLNKENITEQEKEELRECLRQKANQSP